LLLFQIRSITKRKRCECLHTVFQGLFILERMYHKRLNGYAQIGYKTQSAHNQPEKISMIYDSNNFAPVMINDFGEAKEKILIVSPLLRRKRIDIILEWLKKPLQAGVSIGVIIRPVESGKDAERLKEGIEYLQTSVTVIKRPNIHQKFVLIDSHLIWYGSINLLSYGSAEESIMRLESRELAAELEAIVVRNLL